jgi:sentrin-specific protease 1
MTGGDFNRLAPGEWLNDTVVDAYIGLLRDRPDATGTLILDSFFFDSIYTGGPNQRNTYEYDGGRTRAKRVETSTRGRLKTLADVSRFIIPMNINNNHWLCVVVDVEKNTIEWCDSLRIAPGGRLRALLKWLSEDRDKKGLLAIKRWKVTENAGPEQTNGFDCGVFMLVCMEYRLENRRIDYDQRHMDALRKLIALRLLDAR